MERARHEQAGELAVRACGGLKADRGEAADLPEQLSQEPHQLQAPLAEVPRIERVRLGEAREPRGPLVDLGVVLHRARAEGVEADLDRMVEVAEAVEMSQQVELAHLGEMRSGASRRGGRQGRLACGSPPRGIGWRGKADGAPSRARRL